MDSETIERLLALNRSFYRDFAVAFSQTRHRVQPGVARALEHLDPAAVLLDIGCGNGELWRWLADRGHTGIYMGLDFSPGLLEAARNNNQDAVRGQFFGCDLTRMPWNVPLHPLYDVILAFAVLHHIPGEALRERITAEVFKLLKPGGLFIHSNWQFMNSPRWVERIQPWETVGLSSTDMDPGDTLLDWRNGGIGYRYVHHFTLGRLFNLAEMNGFEVQSTFMSDGKEGNLSIYQVWKRPDIIESKT